MGAGARLCAFPGLIGCKGLPDLCGLHGRACFQQSMKVQQDCSGHCRRRLESLMLVDSKSWVRCRSMTQDCPLSYHTPSQPWDQGSCTCFSKASSVRRRRVLPAGGIVPAEKCLMYDRASTAVRVRTSEESPRGVALGSLCTAGYRSNTHAHLSNGSKPATASCKIIGWVLKRHSLSKSACVLDDICLSSTVGLTWLLRKCRLIGVLRLGCRCKRGWDVILVGCRHEDISDTKSGGNSVDRGTGH